MFGRLRTSIVAHPWISIAAVLSVAAPIAVAFLPSNFSGSRKIDAVINELPIPSVIEFHDGDPSPIETQNADFPNRSNSPHGAPHRLDGISATPLAAPEGSNTRLAHYRDDLESPGQVENVSSNRPMQVGPRGAWLTGTIEETPRNPILGIHGVRK